MLNDTTTYAVPRTRPATRVARREVAREGVITGTFAAAGVALMLVILDVHFTGRVFTPSLLGAGLGRLLGIDGLSGSLAAIVYTVAHFAAFIVLATALAAVLRRARRDASILAAALLLVAVVELAFFGFVALLGEASATAAAAWPQFVSGNVIGWLLLGARLWRTHPELCGEFAAAVRGATGAYPVVPRS